ncbi:hypothetical protein [Streptomyces cylindrosporus]|uniref:HNH endonuclease n=1 Tax=Streptomyces cylindrosporus TaxID=2927583 RepID=A0ABS9YK09_9ACTN|nr:hypothetical protein [Streptomyces cylindrosporus]MCI3277582.1 hypothetical protein [Streptomyces cylindrosporus]
MIVERTGRARAGRGCRWCGPRVETVLFEVEDTKTGGVGTEAVCCTCGKSQHRWGLERRFWAAERHKELVVALLVGVWLSEQVIRLAKHLQLSATQLALFTPVAPP